MLFHEGLEGVTAAQSRITRVDGHKAQLFYCGYDIDELAKFSTYEEVVYLLWHQELPTAAQLNTLKKELIKQRRLPPPLLRLCKEVPRHAHPMAVLRTAVSALALYDHEADAISPETNKKKALSLTAKFPTITAAAYRASQRKPIVPSNPRLSHAANFLYMLTGKKPDDVLSKAMDLCLVLHADHELNASTFAARVTIATLSDMYSAVTSAIGTLKGPLHGGANQQVMKMLKEIKTVDNVKAYVRQKLARHEKIMGIGHRVYKTGDPRAKHLAALSKQLGEPQWYRISKAIEEEVYNTIKLKPNVDFYSASAYYAMGIPLELYPSIFALSRIAGWTAHIMEQYTHNRLIRPLAEYIGHKPRQYVCIEKR